MIAVLAVASVLVACHGELDRLRVRRRLGRDGLLPRSTSADTRLTAPPRVAAALHRAAVDDPDLALTVWVTGVAVCAAAAPVVAAARVLLVAAVVAPPAVLVVVGDRRGRRRARQLPDALDAVAAGLRGGVALAPAIGGAAVVGPPLGPELTEVADTADAGRPLDEALAAWATAACDTSTGLAVAALTVATRVGGPGARAVDGAAASLRDRLDADAEAAALATQGRVSALVLTVAPVAFALLLTGIDPRAGAFLLTTRAGWACVAAGITLDALGAWWMSRLVRRAR